MLYIKEIKYKIYLKEMLYIYVKDEDLQLQKQLLL